MPNGIGVNTQFDEIFLGRLKNIQKLSTYVLSQRWQTQHFRLKILGPCFVRETGPSFHLDDCCCCSRFRRSSTPFGDLFPFLNQFLGNRSQRFVRLELRHGFAHQGVGQEGERHVRLVETGQNVAGAGDCFVRLRRQLLEERFFKLIDVSDTHGDINGGCREGKTGSVAPGRMRVP